MKLLIVDDSEIIRIAIENYLKNSGIEIIGQAGDGAEALKIFKEKKPDIVTMDIHMPIMDGFEATRKIMESNPVPIVICSASWNPEEVDKTFRTMEAGAVAALEKPRGMGHPDSEASVKELLQTIKLMSDVKVVRRWSKHRMKKSVKPVRERLKFKTSEKKSDVKNLFSWKVSGSGRSIIIASYIFFVFFI